MAIRLKRATGHAKVCRRVRVGETRMSRSIQPLRRHEAQNLGWGEGPIHQIVTVVFHSGLPPQSR